MHAQTAQCVQLCCVSLFCTASAGPHLNHPALPSPPACRYGAPPVPDRGPTHIDVFQDFEPQQGAADAAAGSAQPQQPASAAKGGNALSAMFKPPEGVLYHGDFEAAKAHATDKGRWLLVNVQTADEFASHRLNRDTWGNELVQDMVRESFVLWQVSTCKGVERTLDAGSAGLGWARAPGNSTGQHDFTPMDRQRCALHHAHASSGVRVLPAAPCLPPAGVQHL